MKRIYQITVLLMLIVLMRSGAYAQGGWQAQTNPAGQDTLLGMIQFINNNQGWIATGNGGYLQTSNGGATWTKHYPFPNDTLSHASDLAMGMSWVGATHGWMLCGKGTWMNDSKGVLVLSTTNGGATWTKILVDSTGYFPLQIQFVNEQVGWLTMFKMNVGLKFLKTSNGGLNWNVIETMGLTTFNFSDSLHGWAVTTWKTDTSSAIPTNWSIEKTSDGGLNWTRTYTDPAKNVATLNLLNAISANVCWVRGPNNKMLRTTNGGSTWNSIPFPVKYGANSKHKFFHFIDANTGWITEDPAQNELYCVVHHTTNGGANWEVQNSLMNNGSIFSIYFNDASHGWLAGEQCFDCQDSSNHHDIGVIRATSNGGTGLFQPKASASEISIYPNPSFGSVTIESEKEITRVEVFNLLGERVYESRPGIALKQINMTGQKGGVYIFRIYSNDAVTVQKVLLN